MTYYVLFNYEETDDSREVSVLGVFTDEKRANAEFKEKRDGVFKQYVEDGNYEVGYESNSLFIAESAAFSYTCCAVMLKIWEDKQEAKQESRGEVRDD